ncbi:four helix bundle protein [Neolewinella xylanilytica]|uniref:Four helix bundle protein n=1 Tax=Neolewinella xylanilytica TaxID=1514080 RepID=A0A2S6IB29_9BACT|nr:four helix bundle protein [Neolewinella xylanilytica]PPK88672.1 four helix bundle protein [Neolewinella xylanilytica]
MKSYLDLEVYKLSLELFFATHKFSLGLPKHEKYELGSQIRRSADSVNSNIVEGYGRRRYKKDFIRFLTFSYASNLETINHLRKIAKLYPDRKAEAVKLYYQYDELGKRLYSFTKYVSTNWKTTTD